MKTAPRTGVSLPHPPEPKVLWWQGAWPTWGPRTGLLRRIYKQGGLHIPKNGGVSALVLVCPWRAQRALLKAIAKRPHLPTACPICQLPPRACTAWCTLRSHNHKSPLQPSGLALRKTFNLCIAPSRSLISPSSSWHLLAQPPPGAVPLSGSLLPLHHPLLWCCPYLLPVLSVRML